MKKYKIVKKNEDFNLIIAKGYKKSSKNIILFSLDNKKLDYTESHIGFTVSKKNKTAVKRNYNKRILRELVNNNIDLLPKNRSIILIGKYGMTESTFEELNSEIKILLKGVK